MEFTGTKLISIAELGLSQIYLNSEKIASIENWFDPRRMEDFQPLPVHDFGNSRYTLTDGHSRAYVALKSGISMLPVVYDKDDIVTNPIGQQLYKADIEWCKRFKLSQIKDLGDRILSPSAYVELWIKRCDRSYNLLTQASPQEHERMQNIAPNLYLYGASEDLTELYFENEAGKLYMYRDNVLLPEKGVKE